MYVCIIYVYMYLFVCVCSLHTVCLHMFLQNYLHVPFHWLLAAKKKRIDFFWYIQSEIIIWTNILAIGHGDGFDLWWRKLKIFHLAKKVNMKCIATL